MNQKIENLLELFRQKYPEPETALNFTNPFELLVATILSAQSTDKQVNKITNNLFKKYKTPAMFAEITPDELENEIKSIGLYRNKSKYIIQTCQLLVNQHHGKVPQTRKELMKLPGVGRKTANVVLACAFGKQSFPVDTHVTRVSNRIGLVDTNNVLEIEKKLMKIIPEDFWIDMHHWLILHGRETCKAQNPQCNDCFLDNLCNFIKRGR